MKPIRITELLAEIRANLVAFVSIAMFVCLGVGLFLGIDWGGTAIRTATEDSYEAGAMHDLELSFPYGVTTADLAKLAKVEGVTDVEATYSAYACMVQGTARPVLKFQGLTSRIDLPQLVEGRLPTRAGEMALLGFWAREHDVSVGDTITLEHDVTDEDDADGMELLRADTYTVVGLVEHPAYLSKVAGSLGAANIGSGNVDCVAFATQASFDAEAFDDGYPSVYLRCDGLRGLNTFTDAYRDALAPITDAVTELGGTLGTARYDQRRGDAEKKISDAEQDIADGERKIADAERKIADGRRQIADGEHELSDGKQRIADGEQQIASSEDELADARRQIRSSRWQLDNGWAEYRSGVAEYEQGKKEYESQAGEAQRARTQLEDGIAQCEAKFDEVSAQWGPVQEAIALIEGYDALKESLAQINQMIDAKRAEGATDDDRELQELLAAKAQVEGYLEQYEASGVVPADDATRAARLQELRAADASFQEAWDAIEAQQRALEGQLDEIDAKLAAGQERLDAAKATLDSSRATLEQKEAELKDARDQYAAGYERLAQARRELDDGRVQLADSQARLDDALVQLAEAVDELDERRQELEEGKAELADAKDRLGDMEEYEWIVFPRLENGGAQSVSTISTMMGNVRWAMALMFVLIGLFVCYSAVSRLVNDEVVQIGTKKAVGFHEGEIAALYLAFSSVSVLLGTVAAAFVALVVVEGIMNPASAASLTLPAFPPHFDPLALIAGGCIELALILASTWLAIHGLLRRNAIALLNGNQELTAKQHAWERTRLWQRMSLFSQTVVNNCVNDRRRVVATLIGTIGCTALIVSAVTLWRNVSMGFDRHYEQIYHFDTIVYLDDDTADAEGTVTRALDGLGVASAPAYRQALQVRQPDGYRSAVSLYVPDDFDAFGERYRLRSTQATEARPDDEGVWISAAYAEHMGLGVGDEVTATEANGRTHTFAISGVFDFLLLRNEFVMGPAAYRAAFGSAPRANVLLCERGAVDLETLRATLVKTRGYSALSDDYTDSKYGFDQLAMLLQTVSMVYLMLSALMALVVLLNLDIMFVDEKKRELIVLMICGFSAEDAKAYIYRDSIALTVIGIAVGVAFGSLMGSVTIGALEPSFGVFIKDFNPLAAGVGVVGAAVFSGGVLLLALRRIPRFDLTDINRF